MSYKSLKATNNLLFSPIYRANVKRYIFGMTRITKQHLHVLSIYESYDNKYG